MTRDEFMQEARKTAGRILESKENGIMNLVQQAWAEGKRNAEIETLSGLINEVLAKDNNVPRKYAYWVEETNRERHWHCSHCGRVQGIASLSMKYCPECGYEMIEHPWAASGCGQAFSPGMADWISVKDKTPGKDGDYLIFYGDSDLLKAKLCERDTAVGIAYWSEKRNCWWDIEMNRITPNITHWMPLPKPPKED